MKLLKWCLLVMVLATAAAALFLRPVSFLNQALYARECLSGVRGGWVTVSGRRMHYIEEGPKDGPAVVLVHGLGGRAEDWLGLARYLAKAGYRVVMPDLFGFGRSDRPVEFSYSVSDQAEAVAGFMDALGLKQVDLGGWSMGGWIVQLLASRHPERVSKLLIFDSVGLYAPPDWNTALFTPNSADQLNELDALLMPSPPRLPEFLVRDILRVSDGRAWVVKRAVASMLTGKDTTDAMLPALRMPVLLEWGEADRITPLPLGEKMHALIPGSRLEVTKGCGHLAPDQCANQMGPGVVAFVNGR